MFINFNHLKTFYNAFVQKMKGFRGNWNQNDSTADDYIKNRPFYSENCNGIIIQEQVEIPQYHSYVELQSNYTAKVGETYIVNFNGADYECIAWWSEDEAVIIGNGSIYGGDGKGEEVPFSFDSYDDGSIYLNISNDDGGLYDISISGSYEIIHKLDPKYLPDDIGVPDDVATIDDIYGIINNELAPVAFTNNYDSLSGKPTVYTDVVRYNTTQSLTDDQKEAARQNIGVPTLPLENTGIALDNNEIIWNGNMSGLVSISINGKLYYKVSDMHLAKDSIDEVAQQIGSGGTSTISSEHITKYIEDAQYSDVILLPNYCVSAPEAATYTMILDSTTYTFTVPEKGVYFARYANTSVDTGVIYTKSLKWSDKIEAIKFNTPYIALPSSRVLYLEEIDNDYNTLENKPCSIDISKEEFYTGYMVLNSNHSGTINCYYSGGSTAVKLPTEGKQYEIKITRGMSGSGEVICSFCDTPQVDDYIYLGNRFLYDNNYPDTGELLCFRYHPDGSWVRIYGDTNIFGVQYDSCSLYEINETVHKLDAKYLPDEHINSLIDAKLGVIENGSY